VSNHHIILQDQVLLSFFPGDTQLIALDQLMNRERRQNIIKTLLPAHLTNLETFQGKLETLAYKPERRYVGRLALKNGTSVLLKHYRKRKYHNSALATNVQAPTSEQLRIPRLLGASKSYQSLMFEWLPGTLLDTEIKTNPDVRSLHASGVALAKFHTITTNGLTHRTLKMRAEKLTDMAKTIAQFYPSLGKLSHDTALLIVENIQHEPSVMQRIHGDFYPKQIILMAEGQVAIIDHDENRCGDPMEDLGLFIAHLLRDKYTKRITHNQTEQLIEALIEGYESITQKTVTRKLYCYVAAGLFSLTHSPFRNHKSNWPKETLIMLELINSIMHSSNSTTRLTIS
ncbi:MAG: phosphotransferase, partial [Thiomicrorhabdus sp.]|nr:phosphotransferase [Thiomicrorhabdus sp.]